MGSACAVRAGERIDALAEPLVELTGGAFRAHAAGGYHAELHADAAVLWRRDAAALSVGVARLDVVAHARREAIRTDEQVEALALPVVEDQVDAVLVLVDGDELPAEPHLGLRLGLGFGARARVWGQGWG